MADDAIDHGYPSADDLNSHRLRRTRCPICPEVESNVVVRSNGRAEVLHQHARICRVSGAKSNRMRSLDGSRSRVGRCVATYGPARCAVSFKAAVTNEVRPFGPNRIVTSTRIDRVRTCTTRNRIDSPAAGDNIAARTAIDGIVAIATG